MLQKVNLPVDVVVIPGSRHTPDEYWYLQLTNSLRSNGLGVLYPQFPPLMSQNLPTWNNVLKQHESDFTDATIFIGHSLGGRFLLNYFRNHKAGAAFLVATPFQMELGLWKEHMSVDPGARELFEHWSHTNGTFFTEPIDWESIANNVGTIHLFYSTRDLLIPQEHILKIQELLRGKIHWIENGRHLDIGLERMTGLEETILKTFGELNASRPEGQKSRNPEVRI